MSGDYPLQHAPTHAPGVSSLPHRHAARIGSSSCADACYPILGRGSRHTTAPVLHRLNRRRERTPVTNACTTRDRVSRARAAGTARSVAYDYHIDDTVEWNWSNGTGVGKIIEREDGQHALKSSTELT